MEIVGGISVFVGLLFILIQSSTFNGQKVTDTTAVVIFIIGFCAVILGIIFILVGLLDVGGTSCRCLAW